MPGTVGQFVAALFIVGAIVTAVAGIAKGLLYLGGLARKMNRWLDDWNGEPPRPGFPNGTPGVLDRIRSIENKVETLPSVEARLAALEAQMHPNGGGSLRDVIDHTAATVAAAVASNDRSAVDKQESIDATATRSHAD